MTLLLFLVVNLLLMTGLFLAGVYLFMQIDEKRKAKPARRLAADVELAAVDALRHEQGDAAALEQLMREADVDRYTAEAALKQLRERQQIEG